MFYKNQENAAQEVVDFAESWLNQPPFERKVFHGIVVHGELQAGKTGVLQLSAKGLEKIDPQNDIMASQMYSNTENQQQFENDMYDHDNVEVVSMTTIRQKIQRALKGKEKKFIERLQNVNIIMIDESEYRIGGEDELESTLFDFIDFLMNSPYTKGQRFCFIFFGATNYSLGYLMDSFQIDFDSVYLENGEGYRGVQYFKDNNLLIDYPKEHKVKNGLHPTQMKHLNTQLDKYNEGLYLIRASNHQDAQRKYNQIVKEHQKDILNHDLIVERIDTQSVKSDEDARSISESIDNNTRQARRTRVVLIVVGALSAGKRLRNKGKIRLVIENRGTKASSIQGLTGRTCGYHDNSPLVITPMDTIDEYLYFHDCMKNGKKYNPAKFASTHLSGQNTTTYEIPCKVYDVTDFILQAFPDTEMLPNNYQKPRNWIIEKLKSKFDEKDISFMLSHGHRKENLKLKEDHPYFHLNGTYGYNPRKYFPEAKEEIGNENPNFAKVGWFSNMSKERHSVAALLDWHNGFEAHIAIKTGDGKQTTIYGDAVTTSFFKKIFGEK